MKDNLKASPFFLDDDDIVWVEQTLSTLSTEEKIGQLFCVLFRELTPDELDEVNAILLPGGCMYRPAAAGQVLAFSNRLKKEYKIPPLIAANLEKGGVGIVTEGTLMGCNMEMAATDDLVSAERLAEVCAREGTAVGANCAFAPVIDIDCNFRNPITNTRTFGAHPDRVAAMGSAYVKKVQAMGLAATVKHFPGDGHDERDHHLVTAVNGMECEEWLETYGMVYRRCIEAGALCCMMGHIMQPAWSRALNPGLTDGEILPASLSPELMQGLLRGKLGFNGLIITDASTMAGFSIAMSRRDAVPACIAAGADMLLFSRNLREDYEFMKAGVADGTITAARLDEAVTRILALKAALRLHHPQPPLAEAKMRQVVGCEQHRRWAGECADQAITLVKEQAGVLPITAARFPRVLFYPLEAAGGFSLYTVDPACEKFIARLRAEGFAIDVFTPADGMEGQAPPYMDTVKRYDLIIYVANLTTKSNQTVVRIEWKQPMGADCGHYLNDVPTVFISLENPYHLIDFPRVKTYINCYSNNDEVIRALIEKLTGRSSFRGKSPVDPFCGKWDARI